MRTIVWLSLAAAVAQLMLSIFCMMDLLLDINLMEVCDVNVPGVFGHLIPFQHSSDVSFVVFVIMYILSRT